MLGRLILSLIWLTCVQSDGLNNMPMEAAPMASKMSMTMETDMSMAAPMAKAKRYLNHQHSSPCPPFYPHYHMPPEPMYAMRPYAPAYPKQDIHVQQHSHQPPQFIHQPPYMSYVQKQMVQYLKPHHISPPVYQHPVVTPPVQHVHPVQSTYVKPLQRWFPFEQPMHNPKMEYLKQPVFSYAPAYHKPMPMIWPQSKKIDYPISYPKSTVIYKPEAPKCAPCPQNMPPPQHQPQPQHYKPTISYIKVAPSMIHQPALPPPSNVYLPAPVHQPLMKPCDK